MDFKAKAREIVQRELKAYHVSPRQGVDRFDIYQAIEDALKEAFDAGGDYEQVRSDRQPIIGSAIACKGIVDCTGEKAVVRPFVNWEKAFHDLAGWVLSCEDENTAEWMTGLVEKINECAALTKQPERFVFRTGMIYRDRDREAAEAGRKANVDA